MGQRLGKVRLADYHFNLLPDKLGEFKFTAADALNQAYLECYKQVFPEHKADNVLKHEDIVAIVTSACQQFRCSAKLFFTTVMYGHRLANPGARFYSSTLVGEAATRRFTRYRQAIVDQYGSFDEDTLGSYANDQELAETFERNLLHSEVLAGNWLVGYKIKSAGKAEELFYSMNELRLNEIWLAIEPSYAKLVLFPWLKDRQGTQSEQALRVKVSRLIGQLKSDRKRAISAFKTRERIMAKAVKEVLANNGFAPEDFEIPGGLELSPITFWSRIGLAIQHLRCLEYYSGSRLALMALNNGKVGGGRLS